MTYVVKKRALLTIESEQNLYLVKHLAKMTLKIL